MWDFRWFWLWIIQINVLTGGTDLDLNFSDLEYWRSRSRLPQVHWYHLYQFCMQQFSLECFLGELCISNNFLWSLFKTKSGIKTNRGSWATVFWYENKNAHVPNITESWNNTLSNHEERKCSCSQTSFNGSIQHT